MKLLLVSHLQGEGEWKMTSRSGRRSVWSPPSAAQGFMEHAVFWDLLPASGISLCATLDRSLAFGNGGIQLVGMQPREKMESLPLSALLYFLFTASLGSKHEPRSLGLSHIPLQFLRKPS